MINNRCITNLLKFINLLQINSTRYQIDEGCQKPYLGPNNNNQCYNTRPITIYTKDGSIFETTYKYNNETNNSSIFRIEKLNNDCVTLLILRKDNNTYINTNSYVTINTNCICAIKCLKDTFVENICNIL